MQLISSQCLSAGSRGYSVPLSPSHFGLLARWIVDLSTTTPDASFAPSITSGRTKREFYLSASHGGILIPPRVRTGIREGHPDFIVTADSWPSFLFPNAQGSIANIEAGLFRSAILLKVCVVDFSVFRSLS